MLLTFYLNDFETLVYFLEEDFLEEDFYWRSFGENFFESLGDGHLCLESVGILDEWIFV